METRKKGSHLNIEERRQIAILDKEGWSPYKIGKKLKRASNTIRNELKRGTVKQVVGYKETEIYFPDTGDIEYCLVAEITPIGIAINSCSMNATAATKNEFHTNLPMTSVTGIL